MGRDLDEARPVLYTGGQAAGWSLAVDRAGDVVVAGSLRGSVDFGCGPISAEAGTSSFVAKLDPCHACVWSQADLDEVVPPAQRQRKRERRQRRDQLIHKLKGEGPSRAWAWPASP
jgi:hypothetical protein